MGLGGLVGRPSFGAGHLSVELDFLPGTPVMLKGLDKQYPELPTLPSDMAQLKASITQVAEQSATLPIEQMVLDVSGSISAARSTVDTIRNTVVHIADQITPIADNVRLAADDLRLTAGEARSEEHTSELQSLMRISYAGFCLKKKINKHM